MQEQDIRSVESEAGVVATLVNHPEFAFLNEQISPNKFTEPENAYLFYAIVELARRGVTKIDAYNIINILNSKESTKPWANKFTVESLTEFIDLSRCVARHTQEEYLLLVDYVIDRAFRRDLLLALKECEKSCFDNDDFIQSRVYTRLDKLLTQRYAGTDATLFGDRVDQMWKRVLDRQKGSSAGGYPTKFPALDRYYTYERGELVLVCAPRKEGKSIFLMNELIDKIKQGARVLYIDSEMSDDQHYVRMLSHLSGVPVSDIKAGNYNPEEEKSLESANNWIKEHPYVHMYMTHLDQNKILIIVKRLMATFGLNFVIVDYIKSEGSISSSEVYNAMGEYCNFLKNRIAGELDLPVLAAAQLNRGGEISDSYKLEQIASVVCNLKRKSVEEYKRDGARCGNYKLHVKLSRVGAQMNDPETEYVDLQFIGDTATINQAESQHVVNELY